MIILGAGMAGLLCGIMNPNSVIYEKSADLPNEHKAVLRMRKPDIGKLTGIPFKQVCVYKSIWSDGQERAVTPRLAHLYSFKVAGKISARSILNLEPVERYIPPHDFVNQLRAKVSAIMFNSQVLSIHRHSIVLSNGTKIARDNTPVVSTLPMPVAAGAMGMEYEHCSGSDIFVTHLEVSNCDAYATVYYPDEDTPVYRATLNSSTMIIESTSPITYDDITMVCYSMGVPGGISRSTLMNKVQRYGKINEIDHHKRQQFILDCTLNYGVYSLGRFATWRPKVMLDDVLDDILVIRRLIEQGNYAAFKLSCQA